MRAAARDQLSELIGGRPHTQAIVGAVLEVWPEHAAYLAKSFAPRGPDLLDITELAAEATLRLTDGEEKAFAEKYRWTCDRLNEEELFFHREGRYRLSTFAEADAEVYSNRAYMASYMGGLLYTQVLWYNHCATLDMFFRAVIRARTEPFDYLEIGPGHGLMLAFAAEAPLSRRLEAWDVSQTSIDETRRALAKLKVAKPVELTRADIVDVDIPDRQFDLVVISEVLEHLEDPSAALRTLRTVIRDSGLIYVNVPINSPSPDHLYLLTSLEEVRSLVEGGGFRIEDMRAFATQGRDVAKALAMQVSVSVGLTARPI